MNGDARPLTVVLHQYSGIGDLVWHIPYFKAVAAQSRGGQVAVIASPTTFARQLLSAESWVSEVIDHDNRPRRAEQRAARHRGLRGIWRLAGELRPKGFERIVIFSSHANRGLLAVLAGIPQRLGFGFGWLQRCFLNRPPYIRPYRGPSVTVYKDVTAFAMAHGFCDQPLLPRVTVPPPLLADMTARLARQPRPLYVFGIGSSEPHKQWGATHFSALAERLTRRGCGVVVLGGPAEEGLATDIAGSLGPEHQGAVQVMCRESVIGSAAILSLADACIANDTGVANLAAACARPSYVLLGPRPLLDHDPLMRLIRASQLQDITPEQVVQRLSQDKAPGFGVPHDGDA